MTATRNSQRLECRRVATERELDAVFALRWGVFVDEQGVDPAIERDEYDGKAEHFACFDGKEIIATGRIVFMEDGWAKLGRITVERSRRGMGVGRSMVRKLIAEAKELKPKGIYASVQMPAKGFYDKLGFTAVGEIYIEADVPHVRMEFPV